LFARHRFSSYPKNVLLIGKAVNYVTYNLNEKNSNIEKLNLVPTFGWPASDMLLAADKGDSYPQIPIGRLSVVNTQEVASYLKKLKEYEAQQRFSSPLVKDMAWKKNVVHTVGASEESLQRILDYYMDGYKSMIVDTLFGANVHKFSKTSAETVEQIKNGGLDRLFEEGISLLTYFGHSSSSTLSYNLNTPENYNNKDGKYPVFFALGCMAGDFYGFSTQRFQAAETISESFTLSPDKGSIVFVASSHYGIPYYLDKQTTFKYKAIASELYGKSVGEIVQYSIGAMFGSVSQGDFHARAQGEEINLHGDPAVTINAHKLPDYAIEDDMVSVSPSTISVADGEFNLNVKMLNIGRATNKEILIQVKQEYPNQTSAIVFQKKITGIHFQDTLSIKIPIDPMRDKGINKLTVIVDALNEVEEAYETNNAVTKEIVIYDDEVRPVSPYNFSIVTKQNIKFFGSTANPMAGSKTYQMELDTTALFNSPLKRSYTATTSGGLVEFTPNTTFLDNTVYFWRLGSTQDNGTIKWNASSFTYVSNGTEGFKQSHKFQHLSSSFNGLKLDSVTGVWRFDSTIKNLFIRNAVHPISGTLDSHFEISINNEGAYIAGGCNKNSILYNVFDPVTLKPWKNTFTATGGLYGSLRQTCGGVWKDYGFEFSLSTSTTRKRAMDFLDLVPDGYIVVVRGDVAQEVDKNTYAEQWKTDEAVFGTGKSLYHMLQSQGVPDLDSFYKPRAYTFIFKKNGSSQFEPKSNISAGIYDRIGMSADIKVPHVEGRVTSPILGPAKEWKQLNWNGSSSDASAGDKALVNVIGVKLTGETDTLFKNLDVTQQTVDVSSINAQQ
ncbi:MAG TPA: C25 family cysteine peptidase, partial [Flavisolibacter sp.]|nr:C25 family cysteine peptidase [Flavisolibacter sp.]